MNFDQNKRLGMVGAIAISTLTALYANQSPVSFAFQPEITQQVSTPKNLKEKSEPLKVGSLKELKEDRTCRGTGGIMTYAETKSFLVYICSDPNHHTQPRYYRSRDRHHHNRVLNLEATNYNPRQMRYFEFKNKGYTYVLQMPMSQIPNPVLGIEFPNGKRVEERVLRYLAKS
ncbi:hypothetical protein C7B65_04705 [Phormidesmis priestleyi ULC007]|uniref:Uncharacterized protein n=1 Tax=Phormidesmis priestleyi ULC007 TaxID=1920490 RepID=A0A2T1DL79_9CYAN|nr:hypothetical protein [Phormidesmis priestleyi]PSB21233.1 hypothetical protein C7B65_04705 [Phormidesmis priestleyi ULC007]PZO51239.1 MAG: hypothetical protein DCF14_09000 [Phormidesmis priestleyi]